MLLLDGRLSKLLAQLPDGADEMVLLDAALRSRGSDSAR
jgi:hypothetical protein